MFPEISLFGGMKRYSEYIPFFLISLLLATEQELKDQALGTSCQMCIIIFTLSIFFILILNFKKFKFFATIISVIVWISLIFLKQKYVG